MIEWLEQFTNPNFMPHGHCYFWRPDILWTHVISDVAIGLSYYVIPVILGILLYKRNDTVPHKEVFALFMAFIFFCGTTHFVNIYVTWFPVYAYQGWLKALTAFVSVLTVAVLAPKLPSLVSLSGLEKAHQETLLELDKLKQKEEQMSAAYSAMLNREERIISLKQEINELLEEQKRQPKYDT